MMLKASFEQQHLILHVLKMGQYEIYHVLICIFLRLISTINHYQVSYLQVLQILKEKKLKYGCKVTMIYSKVKPTTYMYSRKMCQYGYIQRSSPLWIKSHGTKRPISYYRKRVVNDL